MRETIRLGRPEVTLGFLGGIGDDLLCTAPIEEYLSRGARRIWFFTRHPALYSHYDERVRLVTEDGRYDRLAARLRCPPHYLSYSRYDENSDRDTPCSTHLIAEMCRRAGLTGRVRLRPHLGLSPGELDRTAAYAGCIAIQSGSLTAAVPMQNKQWPAERMQQVVLHFTGRVHFVQIGSLSDPPLARATDLRGRTTARATAAILAQARMFVGLVGFLMHLARAVDCPAAIVYGGREPAAITGYSAYTNLAGTPPCSPCWQRNRCAYGRVCLEQISALDVIEAIEATLARPRGPLPVEEAAL